MLAAALLGACAELPPAVVATPSAMFGPEACGIDAGLARWLDCRELQDSRSRAEALPAKPSEVLPPGAPGPVAGGRAVLTSAAHGGGPVFLVVGPADLSWTLEGASLEIAELASDLAVSRTLLDRRKAGTGRVRLADAGSHLLRIAGEGRWRIEVRALGVTEIGEKG